MLEIVGEKPPTITAGPCIIEETPDRIVVALPVSKQTIAEIQPFLAILTGTAPPPKVEKINRSAAPFYVALAAAIGLAWLLPTPLSLYAAQTPPLEYGVAGLAGPYSNSDRILRVYVPTKRNRLCATSVARLVRDVDDDLVAWSHRVDGTAITAPTEGFVNLNIAVELPRLDPGPYEFVALVHSNCGPGDNHHAAIKVPFDVTD